MAVSAALPAAATEKLAQRIRNGQASKVKAYDKAVPLRRPVVVPTPEVQQHGESQDAAGRIDRRAERRAKPVKWPPDGGQVPSLE